MEVSFIIEALRNREYHHMSISSETVTMLTEPQLDRAVQILVNAFLVDPLTEYLFPENEKRDEQLRLFIGTNLQYALVTGEIYTSLNGVAAWLFPGDKMRPRLNGVDDPRSQLSRLLESGASARLTDFTKSLAAQHKDLTGRYYYLLFLGVNPGKQGQGIGSALIGPMLKVADESSMRCLLDTMNERDLEFYHKHDFEVCCESRLCGNGPYTWTMMRLPRM
jgi:ribosomal protein S18 acetylase RimI-like enzyme